MSFSDCMILEVLAFMEMLRVGETHFSIIVVFCTAERAIYYDFDENGRRGVSLI
jgi:hypothetical protein